MCVRKSPTVVRCTVACSSGAFLVNLGINFEQRSDRHQRFVFDIILLRLVEPYYFELIFRYNQIQEKE